MTDPVDTDALRTWNAGRADEKLFPMVAAAADEVDRLREANEEAEAARFAAAGYGDRLRAVIENAPHANTCLWPHGDDHPDAGGSYCDCWKAHAL